MDCPAHLKGRSLHRSRTSPDLREGPGALKDARWSSLPSRIRVLRTSIFPFRVSHFLVLSDLPIFVPLYTPRSSPIAHTDTDGARRGPSVNAENVNTERNGMAQVPTSTLMSNL